MWQPLLQAFNKVDVVRPEFAFKWMQDLNALQVPPPHRLPHTLLSSAKFQLVPLPTKRFQLSCTLSPRVAGLLDAATLEMVHDHTDTSTNCQLETTTTFPDVLNLTRSFVKVSSHIVKYTLMNSNIVVCTVVMFLIARLAPTVVAEQHAVHRTL